MTTPACGMARACCSPRTAAVACPSAEPATTAAASAGSSQERVVSRVWWWTRPRAVMGTRSTSSTAAPARCWCCSGAGAIRVAMAPALADPSGSSMRWERCRSAAACRNPWNRPGRCGPGPICWRSSGAGPACWSAWSPEPGLATTHRLNPVIRLIQPCSTRRCLAVPGPWWPVASMGWCSPCPRSSPPILSACRWVAGWQRTASS